MNNRETELLASADAAHVLVIQSEDMSKNPTYLIKDRSSNIVPAATYDINKRMHNIKLKEVTTDTNGDVVAKLVDDQLAEQNNLRSNYSEATTGPK